MKAHYRVLLLLVPLAGLTWDAWWPAPREAAAQGFQRRDDDDDDDDDEPRGGGDFRRGGGRRRGGGGGPFGGGGGRGFGRDRAGDDERGGSDRPARFGAPGGSGGSNSERSSRSGDRGSVTSSSGSSGAMNMTSYARSLVRQNDKNGDGMLQADEQGALRGPASRADFNSDKVITSEEIMAALSGNTTAASSSASATSGGSNRESRDDDSGRSEWGRGGGRFGGRDRRRGGDDGDRDDGDAPNGNLAARVFTALAAEGADGKTEVRRTYRFKPAAERLPNGLPSSFKSRDRNQDGQIAMSEFSRSWSERTARDFARYDLNGDGMITPKEALKSNWR
jgi:hypothetical protein